MEVNRKKIFCCLNIINDDMGGVGVRERGGRTGRGISKATLSI